MLRGGSMRAARFVIKSKGLCVEETGFEDEVHLHVKWGTVDGHVINQQLINSTCFDNMEKIVKRRGGEGRGGEGRWGEGEGREGEKHKETGSTKEWAIKDRTEILTHPGGLISF